MTQLSTECKQYQNIGLSFSSTIQYRREPLEKNIFTYFQGACENRCNYFRGFALYLCEMDTEQEQKLIKTVKNNLESFGELYDQYYPQIFGYVLRRTFDVSLAQDVTSNVFLKALNNFHKYEWRGIPISAWLYRIASHEIAQLYRNNHHRQFDFENIPETRKYSRPSAEDEVIEAENELQKYQDFIALHNNIKKLTIKYQEVITLKYFEHKQIKEIAIILNKREGTVKSLIHRGLDKLKTLMEKE
ncbi:MAG: RNA polymerase sigma factor [Dehalococcoidales bacterium]|nr:RNA polymerase sigma factor [Dehalococcoidales bacterium]